MALYSRRQVSPTHRQQIARHRAWLCQVCRHRHHTAPEALFTVRKICCDGSQRLLVHNRCARLDPWFSSLSIVLYQPQWKKELLQISYTALTSSVSWIVPWRDHLRPPHRRGIIASLLNRNETLSGTTTFLNAFFLIWR